MARIWITPEGKVHSTAREDTHLTMATELAEKHGLTLSQTVYDDVDNLFKHDFVRFSDGNVEGKIGAIRKHVDVISSFFQTELARRGKSYKVYYDFLGRDGKRIASGEAVLGEISFWDSYDWDRALRNSWNVPKERSTERRGLRRRPDNSVRVRPYQRRQGRTKPL